MKKSDFGRKVKEFFTSKRTLNIFLTLVFAVTLTGILVSKYFYQTIVGDNNTSKIEVKAPRDIIVIDSVKTEARRREVAKNVDFIYKPSDNLYIQNNLAECIDDIKNIRKSDVSYREKQNQLEVLLDVSNSDASFVISYILNSPDESLEKVFVSANKSLSYVLSEGITEKDFEQNSLNKIIRRNIEPNTLNAQIKVITALLKQVIVPNMIIDEETTAIARKNAREMVAPIKVKFDKGDTIIKVGEPVTLLKKEALSKAGYNILKINYKGILGIFSLVCLGIFSIYYYLRYFEPKFLNLRHMLIVAVLSLIIAIWATSLPLTWSVFTLPFPFFAIVLSVFFNPRTSFFITVTLITIIALSLQLSALAMSIFVLAAIVSTIGMPTIKYSFRFDLVRVGLYTSVVMALIIISVYHDLGFRPLLNEVGAGVINGFGSGVFALGIIPFIENTFKVVTMFGLAELGDYNQPLLKKLHEVAPGTFEHSLRVSNLAESAAEAIGANPILARVGALYHDIGKIKRPLFFVENQTYSGIENPHDKRTPRESKMYITSHTKDGLAFAKEYHLPDVIQDFIIQHHGDSLVSYFYNKAVSEEGVENVHEEQFRYTGPRPNTKETAIVMIADAVESASRTLKDQSQEEIEKLIDKLIQDRLDDKQLSDSPLTLKDIKVVSATLSRVLRSVFHKRIKYQEANEETQEKSN